MVSDCAISRNLLGVPTWFDLSISLGFPYMVMLPTFKRDHHCSWCGVAMSCYGAALSQWSLLWCHNAMAIIVSRNTREPKRSTYQHPGNANSRRSRADNRSMIYWIKPVARLTRHAGRGKQLFVESFNLSFQSATIVVLTCMCVLDKRNTMWLRDTVRKTSWGKSSAAGLTRNHEVFLLLMRPQYDHYHADIYLDT